MTAQLILLADAVVAELNAHAFSQPFTAQRLCLPVFELKEMQNLHVTIVPQGLSIIPTSRSRDSVDYAIDVAVQKKLASLDAAEIDPLLTLVEEIADFFRHRRLAAHPEAAWIKTENEPVYSQEHLRGLRQLTSVLTLTFRVVR
jgi:hypothetical protein